MFSKGGKSKLLDKAQRYIQKGYLDKAVAEYNKAIDMDPNDMSIRLRVGDLYIRTGREEEGVKEYFEVAKTYTKKGFYLKAIAVFKQILKINDTDVDIRYKLADLYVRQGLIADAISEYSSLAKNFEAKKRPDEVLTLVKKMVEIAPDNVGIRLRLADIYKKMGYKADALTEYEHCVTTLIDKKKYAKAEDIYMELYASNPSEPRITEVLARLCRARGDNDGFIRYSKELVGLYGEQGEEEKKRETYERLLEVCPDDEDALKALGRVTGKPGSGGITEEAGLETGELPSWPEFEDEAILEVTPPPLTGEDTPAEDATVVDEEIKEEPLIPWSDLIDVQEPDQRGEPEVVEEGEEEHVVPSVEELDVVEELTEVEPISEEIIELEDILEEVPLEEEGSEEVGLEVEAADFSETASEVVSVETSEELPHVEESGTWTEDDEYIDLSTDLGIEEAMESLVDSWSEGEAQSTLDEFKDGIGKQLSKEDTETHYNLAVAYMEITLYDEAIKEFKLTIKDPALEFDSYVRLGMCYMAKGDPNEAISYYIKGLKVEGVSEVEKKGLMYELALSYEVAGQREEAHELFKNVYNMDNDFRDVSEKIQEFSAKGSESSVPLDDGLVEVELL